MPAAAASAEELAELIDSNITQEFQADIWRHDLPDALKQACIDEQKHKYGTLDFLNSKLPRIVTEKTRSHYIRAIREDQALQDAGYKLLGIGFSGAAFEVAASKDDPLVPHYVLKVPVTREGVPPSKMFAPLDDEFPELNKLTEFSKRFAAKIGEADHFSQKLAAYEADGQCFYLGHQDKANTTVLATVFQPGDNLYQRASQDIETKLLHKAAPDPSDTYRNPYLTQGISDNELVNMIRYYQGMAREGINFYDLFPHNMHYVAEERTLRFVDACSKPNAEHQKVIDARQAFPIDYCIYDLLTFLALQEQQHPFAKAIRKDTRLTLKELSASESQYAEPNADERSYLGHLFVKLDQIIRCLNTASKRGEFSQVELQAAITRLADVEHHQQNYGRFYQNMSADLSRLTSRGKKFLGIMMEMVKRPFEPVFDKAAAKMIADAKATAKYRKSVYEEKKQ